MLLQQFQSTATNLQEVNLSSLKYFQKSEKTLFMSQTFFNIEKLKTTTTKKSDKLKKHSEILLVLKVTKKITDCIGWTLISLEKDENKKKEKEEN